MIDSIEKYRLNLVIVQETAARIIRDFEQFGVVITFSGKNETAYDELMSQLVPAVDLMIRTNKARLMQVLYRIDIEERKLKNEMMENNDKNLAEIISRLVIQREMQKVITRMVYKKD